MNEYELHAREYLEYVAKNEALLKKAVQKNITYDERLFDDVFQDTILKVYDYIVTKKKKIKNFKDFHFICNKNAYIQADTKARKEDKLLARAFFDNLEKPDFRMENYDDIKCYSDYSNEEQKLFSEDSNVEEEEQKIANIDKLLDFTKEELESVFPDFEVSIFFIYYKLKANKEKISYKKMADITGLTLKDVVNIISKMKKYIRNNPKILNKKKELIQQNYD